MIRCPPCYTEREAQGQQVTEPSSRSSPDFLQDFNQEVPAVSTASKFLTEFIISCLSHPFPISFIRSQYLGLFLAHVASYVTFRQEEEPGKRPAQALEGTQLFGRGTCSSRSRRGPPAPAGTSLGLRGPTQGRAWRLRSKDGTVLVLAQETLGMDSWRKGFLSKKKLFQERLHFQGRKTQPFCSSPSHFDFRCFRLASEVMRLLLVSEDLENQIQTI